MKGAHRGLQLVGAALNCAARAPLLDAVQLFWHMDMLSAWSVGLTGLNDLLLSVMCVPEGRRRGREWFQGPC